MSWDLRDRTVKWNGTHWSVDVELGNEVHQPSLRIRESTQETELELRITPSEMQVGHHTVGMPLTDAYVRQRDLIATFDECKPWRFGYQIDVRVIDGMPPDLLVMEMWLSIQTSLLDSHPQLSLMFHGDPFVHSDFGYWASRTSKAAILVHPLDQSDCKMDQGNDGLAMKVFGRFMEKGVIRRMRFRLITAASPKTAAYWIERFEEFSESPLPLTT